MKPYANYKASGVDWLGDVPSHWEVVNVKKKFHVQLGKMLQSEETQTDSIEGLYLRSANVQAGYIDLSDVQKMWFNKRELKTLRLRQGDLIVCEGGDSGRSTIWNDELDVCYFQNSINRVRNNGKADTSYLFYWLNIVKQIGWIDIICNKATIMHLTKEKLETLDFVCPPLTEQHAIAAYLDRETARVDALLQGKLTLIALLREYRQSTISSAVTQGLNPAAPRKPSRIAWLGDVPKHWDIKKIKFAVNLRSQKTDEPPLGTRYVGLEHIESKMGRFVDNTDAMQTESESTVTVFQTHDVLFGKLRPYLAKAVVADTSGVCSSEILVLEPLCVAAPYLKLFLLLDGFIKTVDGSTFGSKMPRADWEFIGQQRLSVPPLAEQHAIAAHLDCETARIDALIAHAQAEITLLKELRAATIADAVLGRVDVRTA